MIDYKNNILFSNNSLDYYNIFPDLCQVKNDKTTNYFYFIIKLEAISMYMWM